MPRCHRCGEELEQRGGLLVTLGLSSLDGYECKQCGTLLCSDCYNERTVELAGSAHDTCPTCNGTLQKR